LVNLSLLVPRNKVLVIFGLQTHQIRKTTNLLIEQLDQTVYNYQELLVAMAMTKEL